MGETTPNNLGFCFFHFCKSISRYECNYLIHWRILEAGLAFENDVLGYSPGQSPKRLPLNEVVCARIIPFLNRTPHVHFH